MHEACEFDEVPGAEVNVPLVCTYEPCNICGMPAGTIWTNFECTETGLCMCWHCVEVNDNNPYTLPDTMDAALCVRQLEYAGMMETIRIRQQGFALREDHDVFFKRCRVIAPSSKTAKDLVEGVNAMFGFDEGMWQYGKNKVFLRWELQRKLDGLARVRVRASGSRIARWFIACRRRFAATTVQAMARRRTAVLYKLRAIAAAAR